MKRENRTFEQTLSHGNFIVRDHHVHDVRTLPGVTLLDMIYRLAPKCVGSTAIELRRVVFKQPIVTSEQYDKNICVIFTPIDAHWHVSVSSYKTKDNRRLDDVRYENMECTLYPIEQEGALRSLDIGTFIRESDYQVDMNEVYGLAERADIRHYSFMKTLGTVFCRKNAELMRIRLGDEAEEFRDKFLAHPALLDGSTFAGQSIRVRNRAAGEDTTPYIPFTIDRFRLYQPLPRQIFTYSENDAYWSGQGDPAQDVNATDVAIFNEAGELLAEFKKFSMKRIRSAHLIKSLLDEVKSAAKPQSVSSPAAAVSPVLATNLNNADEKTAASSTAPRSIVALIKEKIAGLLKLSADELNVHENFYDLGMDSTQLLGLTKELEQVIGQELYPTLLFEYSSIEKLGDYLSSEFDLNALLASDAQADISTSATAASAVQDTALQHADASEAGQLMLFSPRLIPQPIASTPAADTPLHRWVICVADSRSPQYFDTEIALANSENVDKVVFVRADGDGIAQKMENALSQIVATIKQLALQLSAQATSQDMLVQIVAGADKGHSWSTMFSGCLKTLSMELPRIRSQLILVDEFSSKTPETVASVLTSEARSARSGATKISYTGNPLQRLTVALQEVGSEVEDADYAFPDRGAIVIAGGLGGLGLIVADYLTTKTTPKLALLGRSSLDAAGQAKIERLASQGAEVMYLPVDLANLDAVENAFRTIRGKFGSVSAVVHSAGTINDQIISRKNSEDIAAVVTPKMSGLWHLDQVSRQDKLDFFMIFSSLSAITGNIGQVDYASANAFMDAFALERQRQVSSGQRSGTTLSINWPLWKNGGMAIDKVVERMMFQSTGLIPLPTALGMDVMAWALQSKLTQLVVTYGAEAQVRKYIASNTPTVAASAQGADRPVSDTADNDVHAAQSAYSADDIAVIGMAGRYPQAANIDEFYQNLKQGKNCISSVPKERWDGYDFGYNIDDYYQFGGFVDQIDMFDPLLFGLPPVKAQTMDPQARLFLETAWEACEDAGFYLDRKTQHYRASGEHSVGVFVGAFWSHYELFGSEHTVRGMPTSMGVSLSSISNTTSYCMNFHGPSVAVDTMCSSALTSVHMACESIRRNECHFAIAGGVNLVTHPHKFVFLKENHFLSSEGVCRSFGANGDGYVPGEGVGAVMLTTVERAVRLGYPIRGIIKGSAINHCGKTAGGTVPNPVAQAEVIADALTAAAVDPRTVSYVEAHGTGTSLGDPIEVQGLTKAFDRWTDAAQSAAPRQYCAIGSSKSNIGHLEAAAGIAGLTKLLLQLEHGEIFPSIHAEELNPLIPFQTTPFYVEKTFRAWERPSVELAQKNDVYPRRALISAFGASGSNASVVVEEYVGSDLPSNALQGETVGIVLSARDSKRLNEQAVRLLSALQQGTFSEAQLPAIAYTLQVGREAMDERLAISVTSLLELEQKLQKFIDGASDIEALYRGRVKRNNPLGALYAGDAGHKAKVAQWVAAKDYAALLELWVDGLVIDWNMLYAGKTPRRIHLPTYPFARNRYWVPSLQATTEMEKTSESAPVSIADVKAAAKPVVSLLPQMPLPGSQDIATPQKAVRRPLVLAGAESVSTAGSTVTTPSKIALRAVHAPAPAATADVTPALAKIALSETVVRPEIERANADQPSLEAIQRSLSNSLSIVLFIDVSEIDLDASFIDLGLDSIIGVQWMKVINSEFQLSLKATNLYEATSIRTLSEVISTALQSTAEPSFASASADDDAKNMPKVVLQSAASANDAVAPSVEDIRQRLVSSLATVLFMDVDEIDDDVSFVEIGVDSIIAVQWVKSVNAAFSASLKATILYEYSTIRSLAAHLHNELRNPIAAPEAVHAAPAAAPTKGSAYKDALPTLIASLKNSLAKVLFMDVSEIDDDSQFPEYGLDSIIAVQWIKSVNSEFGTTLKATVLYENPSIATLAHHLQTAISSAQAGSQSQAVESTSTASNDTTVLGTGASSAIDMVENYRYALNGCQDVKVSLLELAPELHMEVFSIGRGAPVVLMTPMGALATVWMHQIRALSQHYQVFIFHYPGHGQSDLGTETVTFDRIAGGIIKALDLLGVKEKIHLVGWSMGALVAERIALLNAERIRSLSLIGTPSRAEDGDQVESTIALMSKLLDDFNENVPADAEGKLESHFEFIRAPLRLDATIPYLQETLNFDYQGAKEISAKTLVVFGGKDRVISADHGMLLTHQIAGAQCAELPGGGHYLPLQNHEWFNEKLIQFLHETEQDSGSEQVHAAVEQID